MFNRSRWVKKTTNTPLFYIHCYVALFDMKKRKYEVSKTIDYQMLDLKEILGKKIVDIYLHTDADGDELQLLLEDGKQIEICLLNCGKVHIQSD